MTITHMSNSRNSTTQVFRVYDRRRLARALLEEPRSRVYRRIFALLLVAEGHSISEAARRSRLYRNTVGRWIERYFRARRDPTALYDKGREGRPRSSPTISSVRIERAIGRDPRTLGFSATTWTVPLLTTYLNQRYGSGMTERTLRRRLHELGYRWKRPRYIYSEREEHLPQKKGL
jgi:transposase